MKIRVRDNQMKAALEDEKLRKKRFGVNMAKKLKTRLDSLHAAASLADFWPPFSGSERCHELKGDLAGHFSMDLNQPFRLLFRAVEVPAKSEFPDEQQRWKSITEIEIVRTEDTHG